MLYRIYDYKIRINCEAFEFLILNLNYRYLNCLKFLNRSKQFLFENFVVNQSLIEQNFMICLRITSGPLSLRTEIACGTRINIYVVFKCADKLRLNCVQNLL